MSDRARRYLEVVQALVAEPVGAKLLGLGDTGAALAMPDGSAAIIVTADHGADEELAEHWRMLVEKNPGHDLKLVLVGGTEAHRALLRTAQPTVMMRRVVQVFALGDDGVAWAGPRSRLDSPMGRVLTELGKRPPVDVDREALKATIVRPDPQDVARADEQRGFVETLRRGVPHVTIALLATYAIAFGLETMWGGAESIPTFVRMGANLPERAWQEPWLLLSSAWLHSGLLHLGLNAYALWVLGGFLERLLGWQRFLVLYVLAALGGGIASAVMARALLSVGASGAICGMLGAAAALAWRPAGIIPPSVLPVVRRNALVNLALTVGISFLPQVDGMAHLGGALVGGALVASGALTRGVSTSAPRRTTVGLTAAAIACAALMVASFATAIVRNRPWQLAAPGAMVERSAAGLLVTVPEMFGPGMVATEEERTVVTFGDLLNDPLSITITVKPHGLALHDPAALAARFEREGTEPVVPPEGAEMIGKREIDTTGDFPAYRETYRFASGIVTTAWLQLRPDHFVTMQADWWPEHPKAERVAAKSYASLHGGDVR